MALSGMEYMRKQYGLPKFDSVKEFLAMIALVKGRLNKVHPQPSSSFPS